MNRIVLDPDVLTKFGDLTQPLEICDVSGNVLGRLFPATDLSEYQPWIPVLDEEELRQLEQSNQKRYTTAEVLAHLEKL